MKAATPAAATHSLGAPSICAIATGIRPLSRSPNSVMAAAFLPPRRSTLVAPGFLEPSLRGSGRRSIRLTITALENEPSKYAAGTIRLYPIGKVFMMYVCDVLLIARLYTKSCKTAWGKIGAARIYPLRRNDSIQSTLFKGMLCIRILLLVH